VAVGNTIDLAKDPLQFLLSCAREYGEIFFLRVRWLDVYVLCGRHGLDQVLVAQPDAFTQDRLSRGLRDALGESLLVTDGPAWRSRRAMVLPAFRQEQLALYTRAIDVLARREMERWPALGVVDIFDRLADLALAIVLQTVLGITEPVDRDHVGLALRVLMRQVRGILGTGVRVPGQFPTPGNLRARQALGDIEEALRQSLDSCDGVRGDGVLGLLRQARDRGMIGDVQVRDELVTMLLVGHETVALAATYTCWLIAGDEELQQALLDEAQAAAGPPGAAGGPPLLKAVINEALRLYPPVWAMGREVARPVEVADYPLEAGAQVLIPIWVNHRHPDWYSRPESFRPERWMTGETAGLPACAFMPFGAGVRSCLGERLAYQEIELIVTRIVSSFRLAPLRSAISVMPSVTLRPRPPVQLLVARRRDRGGLCDAAESATVRPLLRALVVGHAARRHLRAAIAGPGSLAAGSRPADPAVVLRARLTWPLRARRDQPQPRGAQYRLHAPPHGPGPDCPLRSPRSLRVVVPARPDHGADRRDHGSRDHQRDAPQRRGTTRRMGRDGHHSAAHRRDLGPVGA
jgi:cytochrome P450